MLFSVEEVDQQNPQCFSYERHLDIGFGKCCLITTRTFRVSIGSLRNYKIILVQRSIGVFVFKNMKMRNLLIFFFLQQRNTSSWILMLM